MLKISVVVVCYNERENIDACVSALTKQNVRSDSYEIIFVDNNSTDGTKEIISSYAEKYANIRLINNPVRGIAGSRNVGLMNAQYDYVAFIDADCYASEGWLEKLAAGFERHYAVDKKTAAVGGSNVPPEQHSRFYDVLNIFLNTYLGSHGSVQGMRFQIDKRVPHLPTVNVLYDKKVLLAVGGYDITFTYIGEDQDLSYRLDEDGYHFYYLAGAEIVHKLRPDLRKWLQNMFVYGKGRMWLMRKHPDHVEWPLLLPAVFVFSLPFTLLAFIHFVFLAPLLYFVLVLIVSFIECAGKRKFKYVFDLFILYAGTHIAYGVGECYGLTKNRELYRQKTQPQLVIKAQMDSPTGEKI